MGKVQGNLYALIMHIVGTLEVFHYMFQHLCAFFRYSSDYMFQLPTHNGVLTVLTIRLFELHHINFGGLQNVHGG